MKVKLGFPLTHLVGSVAGTVFQNSQGGLMARTKSYPIGLGSLTTSNVVSALSDLAQIWAFILTDAQRSAWATLAQVSNRKNAVLTSTALTGQNIFIALNSRIQTCGYPYTPIPLAQELTDQMEFPFLEANSILGAVSFSIANGPLASGTFIFLTLSPPVSRGIVGYNSGLKFLKAYRWTPPLIDLTADYAAMFGDLTGQEGQRIWYKAQLVSGISGDASAFQQNSCIVT